VRVTMIKKRLKDGSPCEKCAQSEDMLRRRGLWSAIDEVVWADEGDPESPGMQIAQRFDVKIAPFFLVELDGAAAGSDPLVVKSALKLVKDHLAGLEDDPTPTRMAAEAAAASEPDAKKSPEEAEIAELCRRFDYAEPQDILRYGLERFGDRLGIQLSGGADVVLVDMAVKLGLPFSVFVVDTGRLHSETYGFVDEVSRHYGLTIDVLFPDAEATESLVRAKGVYSFRREGHRECCAVRRIEPLARALAERDAWADGERRTPHHEGAAPRPVIELDRAIRGAAEPRLHLRPLSRWNHEQRWEYVVANKVPRNPLHEKGFRAVGCEPCSRAIGFGQVERDGLWWWEGGEANEGPDMGGGI